jgi:putative inorganic carbon (HCO3(-)) transporter
LINWISLFINSLWLAGLALILAGCNYNSYFLKQKGLKISSNWRMLWYSLPVQVGVLLVCGGMLFNSASWLESILWGLLGLICTWEWWKKWRKKEVAVISSYSSVYSDKSKYAAPNPRTLWHRISAFCEIGKPVWLTLILPLFLLGEGRYLLYGLTALVVLWGVAGFAGREWFTLSPVNWSLVIWLLLIPVTLWATTSMSLTQEYLGYFLAEVVTFYGVISWIRTPGRLRVAAWGLVSFGAVLAAASPFLMQSGNRFFSLAGLLKRLPFNLGESVNRNVMAGALVVLLPLSLGLLIGQTRQRGYLLRFVILSATTMLIAAALVLTQSRGAYLAAGVAILLVITLKWWRVGLALTFVAISFAVSWFIWSGVSFASLLGIEAFSGFDVRLEVWSRALYAIGDFPFTGIGMGTFKLVVPVMYPYFLAISTDPVPHAHNLFLQVAVDLGLPGLIAFLAILFCVVALGLKSWRKWQSLGKYELSSITIGCLGGLCAMLIQGLTDAVTWGTKPAFVAWEVLGLLLASANLAVISNVTKPQMEVASDKVTLAGKSAVATKV